MQNNMLRLQSKPNFWGCCEVDPGPILTFGSLGGLICSTMGQNKALRFGPKLSLKVLSKGAEIVFDKT